MRGPIDRVRRMCLSWPEAAERLHIDDVDWARLEELVGDGYHTVAMRGR